MDKLRIAVLGCGSVGSRHLKNLKSLGYDDVLVFDDGPEIASRVSIELNVVSVPSLDDVWKWKPNVVMVSAPTNAHLDSALAAAKNNCCLFIEKPLSHTLKRVESLCEEVKRRELVTMVGCNMRFHPGPVLVKKLLEEQAVGKVISARVQSGSFLPHWRPLQDYRQSYSASREWGGTILDCIHEIDLTLWYLGPAKIIAAAHRPAHTIQLETDGLAEILLQHDSGPLSSVHLNFVQRDYRRACQIIGSEGTIYWDFSDRCVRVYGADGAVKQSYPEPAGWDVNQMYVDEMKHFLKAVLTGSPAMNPVSEAAATLEVALSARRMGGTKEA
ncbi:MAG: Gfo/Idh/MocA family oxidoreductase [Acidobacteriia bacterium]|nr:Gfo/Idh/MocA family oxidoreductase [Terriglobia bacterium]